MSRTLVKLEDILVVNPSSWSKKEGWKYLRYLDTANITNGRIDEIVTFDTEADKIPSRARRIVQNGDFIYSTVRPNQKHYGLLKNIEENLVVSTGFAVFRSKYPEQFDTRYIYLLVTQDFLTNYLHGIAENNTSAYPALRPQDITDLEFEIPPISDQKLVVDFIENLDDKIELNQKMNQTLEEIAKAIFKSWFVDFDPVRAKAEGRPTGLPPEISDLFPDELADSEIGGIPKGWGLRRLDSLLELAYGKSLPAKNRLGGKIPVYGSGGINGFHNESLFERTSIVVGRKGTVGSLYWVDEPFFPIDTVFYVRSENSIYYCFYLLQTLRLDTMNTDAAVPGLNRDNAYRLEFPNAPTTLVNHFSEIAKSMRDRISIAEQENKVLADLRDTLLPKLISGELRIPDAEKCLEEAGV